MLGPHFVVAVQWHPEERLDDLRLFSGVVQAAADMQRQRATSLSHLER